MAYESPLILDFRFCGTDFFVVPSGFGFCNSGTKPCPSYPKSNDLLVLAASSEQPSLMSQITRSRSLRASMFGGRSMVMTDVSIQQGRPA